MYIKKLKEKLKKLEKKKESLEKKDMNLIISDFDDTIFARDESFIVFPKLIENRGKKGIKVVMEEIGLENFIDKLYKNKKHPDTITKKLRKNHDLILSCTKQELGEAKIKAVGLSHINYKIVDNPEDKIFETIYYVVEKLGFIPKEIIVYEDRPKYFIEYKKLIEDFLGTKLIIYLVKMNRNNHPPKIQKV